MVAANVRMENFAQNLKGIIYTSQTFHANWMIGDERPSYLIDLASDAASYLRAQVVRSILESKIHLILN